MPKFVDYAGGSCYNITSFTRSAIRFKNQSDYQFNRFGFRLTLVEKPDA